MVLMSKQDEEIDSLCYTIITDHLLYECSIDSYMSLCKYLNKTPSSMLQHRIEILSHIKDCNTEEAIKSIHKYYPKIVDTYLYDRLFIQVYIENVYKKDYVKAIDLAREYIKTGKEEHEIFSILGYRNDDKLIKKYYNARSVRELVKIVNENLFCDETGRKKSLLWYAYMQHGSVMSYINK